MSRMPWGQPRHPAIRTRSNDQAGPPQAGGPARSILGGGITCENGLSMAKYPLAEDRKREVGAFLGHCVCRDLAAAAGAQWLLSGVQPSPCTAGSLGDGPAGHFCRELLRAFLSALPKGSSFWRGLAHCLRARTGGVPADRRHSQPSSAPVERISPHPFPPLPC